MRFSTADSRKIEGAIINYFLTYFFADQTNNEALDRIRALLTEHPESLMEASSPDSFTHLTNIIYDAIFQHVKLLEFCSRHKIKLTFDCFIEMESLDDVVKDFKKDISERIDTLYQILRELDLAPEIWTYLLTHSCENGMNPLHYLVWAGLRNNIEIYIADLEKLGPEMFERIFCAKANGHQSILNYAAKSGAPDNLTCLFELAEKHLSRQALTDLLTYTDTTQKRKKNKNFTFLRSLIFSGPNMLEEGMNLLERAFREAYISDSKYLSMHQDQNSIGARPVKSLILQADCESLKLYFKKIRTSQCQLVVDFYKDLFTNMTEYKFLRESMNMALRHWSDDTVRQKHLEVVRCIWDELDYVQETYHLDKIKMVSDAIRSIPNLDRQKRIASFFEQLNNGRSLIVYEQAESRSAQPREISHPPTLIPPSNHHTLGPQTPAHAHFRMTFWQQNVPPQAPVSHQPLAMANNHQPPAIAYSHQVPAIAYTHQAPPIDYTHQVAPIAYAHQAQPIAYTHQAPSIAYTHQAPPIAYAHQAPPIVYMHQVPLIAYTHQVPAMTYHHQPPAIAYSQAPIITYHQQPPAMPYTHQAPPMIYGHQPPQVFFCNQPPQVPFDNQYDESMYANDHGYF